MGALMRRHDWASTPVGPIEGWPQSLRTALGIVLDSSYPMYIAWGAEYTQFYNDGFRPILGASKHPGALGRSAHTTFAESWELIGPMFERVVKEASAIFTEDLLVPLHRDGYVEEVYFTFGYTPIRIETGAPGGVFVTVVETTRRVIGERRLATVSDVAARGLEARTAEEACLATARALADNANDLPFSLIYLLEGEGTNARLVGSSGLERGAAAAPERVTVSERGTWPLAEAITSDSAIVVRGLGSRVGPLPGGPWPESPDSAVVLRLTGSGEAVPAGFLVAGISSRRALDDEYQAFLRLLADQIGASIATARLYEEAEQRARKLAELDRAKTRFLTNVSHEFRTPLTLLLGPLEDALEDTTSPLDPGRRTQLELAHRNALRLLKLVDALLDFSRAEEGRSVATFAPVELGDATALLASAFRSAIEAAGLRFDVRCPALPEPVFVDPGMWEKIVLNLISNALKHTFDGGIEVSLRNTGSGAELSVRDTGTGIPATEVPRIFERFHRVSGTPSRTHEGSGIGLALVHDLVAIHGGTVQVESEIGRGTTFRVQVPYGSDHLPREQIVAPGEAGPISPGSRAFVEEAVRWLPGHSTAGGSAARGRGSASGPVAGTGSRGIGAADRSAVETGAGEVPGRILVVDDNADMREHLVRLLGSSGWEVRSAPDGRAALEAALADPPDLVLTDIMMPNLDGFELLRALRAAEQTASLPILLLSARAGEESRVEGLDAGADDYLIKPFSAQELIARVRSHLALAWQRREAEGDRRRPLEQEAELVGTLQRLGATLFSTLDLGEVVQTVAAEATRLIDAEIGAFVSNPARPDGGRPSVDFVASGPGAPLVQLPLPHGFDGFDATFPDSRVLRRDDLSGDGVQGREPSRSSAAGGAEGTSVRSYLAAPVIARSGEVLGGLFFGHRQAGHFSERDERLIEGIASWAAVAIDSAQLYEAERDARRGADAAREMAERARDRVTRLQRLTEALSRALTAKDVARIVMEEAGPAFGAAAAWLHPRRPTARSAPDPFLPLAPDPVAPDRSSQAEATPDPLLDRLTDLAGEVARSGATRFLTLPELPGGRGFTALLGLPLVFDEEVLGVLSLGFAGPRVIDPEDAALQESLASQCAHALKRTRLFAAERQARTDVEHLSGERQRTLTELEALLSVVPIGIGIARDPECKDIRVNAAFARQLGIDPSLNASKSRPGAEELPFRVLKDGEEVPGEDLPMQVAARERRTLEDLEYDIVHADGRVIRLLEYAAPLLDETGAVRGAVGAFINITERARLIEAERAARAEAERANRAKAEFLASMSHELRTPLNAITGYLQLLEMELHGPLTDAQRASLLRIRRNQEHLLGLINDVLNFARLETGRVHFSYRRVSLADMLADLEGFISAQAAAAGHSLTIVIPDPDLYAWADPDRVTQILVNLLTNAIKYTPPGGAIAVHADDDTDAADRRRVRVHVTDTGIGIAPERLEEIFEPFIQVGRQLNRPSEGIGLGLAISRDLARQMGGEITVVSETSRGSTFTLILGVT